MDSNLEKVITRIPKVELHAHLNGSISENLLNHLKAFRENDASDNENYLELPSIESKGVLMDKTLMLSNWQGLDKENTSIKKRSLKECWNSFAKIHDAIRTPRILYVATVNVIAEFVSDNVIYLELRTGPKKIHEIPSQQTYLESVIKSIEDAQKIFPIKVKLLISIDRKRGKEEAQKTLELAIKSYEKYPEIVTGLDISGDPNYGHSSWIVELMKEARREGLKISCHLPEIVNPEEAIQFISFEPERVGHGQFLHPKYGGTEELWNLAKQKQIPVESCISSNLVSGVAASVDSHIVKIFHEESMPYIICTDDCGVFSTTLSAEFKKAASVIGFDQNDILQLCLKAVTYSFASEKEKTQLTQMIMCWWQENIDV